MMSLFSLFGKGKKKKKDLDRMMMNEFAELEQRIYRSNDEEAIREYKTKVKQYEKDGYDISGPNLIISSLEREKN